MVTDRNDDKVPYTCPVPPPGIMPLPEPNQPRSFPNPLTLGVRTHPCDAKTPARTSVGGPVHGRVPAVVHPGIQGVCGKGGLQQGPQDCSVAAGRGQVNGCAALEVSAQHKRVVVQQGSQAVLTASHCLWVTWGWGARVRSCSLSQDQSLRLVQE